MKKVLCRNRTCTPQLIERKYGKYENDHQAYHKGEETEKRRDNIDESEREACR